MPVDVILVTFPSFDPPYPRCDRLFDPTPPPDGHFRGDDRLDPVRPRQVDHFGNALTRSYQRWFDPFPAGPENIVDEPPDDYNLRTFIDHIFPESGQHLGRLFSVDPFVDDREFPGREIRPPSRVGRPDDDEFRFNISPRRNRGCA